jgi:hypothetical protein
MSRENVEITRRANEVLARDWVCRVAIGCIPRHLFSVRSTTTRGGSLGTQMKALAVAAMLTLSLSAVAGCGGSSKKSNASTTGTTSTTGTATTPAGGGTTTLHLDADPSGALKFIGPDGSELGTGAKNGLKARAGSFTLKMANPSTVAHAIAVKGNGIQQLGPTVSKDGVSTVTANLKAGKYEFYCPVDGHESAGMKGTLIVR